MKLYVAFLLLLLLIVKSIFLSRTKSILYLTGAQVFFTCQEIPYKNHKEMHAKQSPDIPTGMDDNNEFF